MILPSSPAQQERVNQTRPLRTLLRTLAVLLLTVVFSFSGMGISVATAAPTQRSISNATFEWGLNTQQQLGSPVSGCDYFSAGASDGSAAQYRTQQGNLVIIKRGTDGSAVTVDAENRCTPVEGSALGIGQRVLMSKGSGTTDTSTGETRIAWEGTLTVNAYNGMVPWSISDPTLTVAADGTGRLSATLGGWTASPSDPSAKTPLPSTPDVVLADFTGVQVTTAGITATPAFAGVDYFPLVNGSRSTTSAIPDAVKAQRPDWGSWPQSFVDFQYRTGLSTYWHTSGLSADAHKQPLPVSVAFDDAPSSFAPVIVRGPADISVSSGAQATFSAEVSGSPEPQLQWQSLRPGGEWSALRGETGKVLTLNAVPVSDNGMQLRVIASNSVAQTVSAPATLTVNQAAAITITEHPKSVTAQAGAVIKLNVRVEGSAPQYQWQRSVDGGITWTDWGTNAATTGNLPTKSASNSGDQYRVLVSNGTSTPVVSDVATITLLTEPAKITENAIDAMGFVNGKVIFRVYGGGSPEPSWDWQRSADGGATWTSYASNASQILYVNSLTAQMNGDLFRAVAANGVGPDAVSAPAKLTVIPQTVRTVLYSPGAEIDAEAGAVLSLSGAGFQVPDSYKSYLRVGVVEAEKWGDGSAPNKEDFLTDSALVFAATLKRDAGAFARTLTIPAGRLDASKRYLLVTYSAVAGDTSLTNVVPLVLQGQRYGDSAAPTLLDDPSETSLAQSELGLTSAEAGTEITVSNLEPNSWFFTTVYSTPTPLGWQRSDANGSFTVSLPRSLAVGQHSLQVQNAAGVFRAWQSFTVTAGVGGVKPGHPGNPAQPISPIAPIGETKGTSTGAVAEGATGTQRRGADRLSDTGADATAGLVIATVALLLGSAVLVLIPSLRRRSRET